VTLPRASRESAKTGGQLPPRALPLTSSANASATQVTIGRIRPFFSLRGWSHDRLARTACGSRSEPTGHPRPAALRLLARRPGPAHARPPGDPRLDRRCLGSPGRLGVPGAPGSGGWRHRGPGPPGHWHHAAAGRSSRGLEVDWSRPPPPGRSGKISPSNDHLVKGRAMPPLEPIWVVFVTVVLVGCVLLAVRAFRRRRR
jgi:hypothetical protein